MARERRGIPLGSGPGIFSQRDATVLVFVMFRYLELEYEHKQDAIAACCILQESLMHKRDAAARNLRKMHSEPNVLKFLRVHLPREGFCGIGFTALVKLDENGLAWKSHAGNWVPIPSENVRDSTKDWESTRENCNPADGEADYAYRCFGLARGKAYQRESAIYLPADSCPLLDL